MLPLDERLACFDSHCFSKIGELELGDEAFAAVSVRLMLQRKYFVRGKDLFLGGCSSLPNRTSLLVGV